MLKKTFLLRQIYDFTLICKEENITLSLVLYKKESCFKLKMNTINPYNKPISPIHKKALEIFTLSSQISKYLIYDLAPLQSNGFEDPSIYFTGDIVQQSNSLAPQIMQAESKLFSEERHQHVLSLSHLTNVLYKNCERLERVNSNGKEFLPLLRKELKKFKKLQHIWMLTL